MYAVTTCYEQRKGGFKHTNRIYNNSRTLRAYICCVEKEKVS